MWVFKNGFYVLNLKKFEVKVSSRLIDENLIVYDTWLNQIHSDKIYIVDSLENLPKGNLDGDGIILKIKNVKARIKTADCYPVIIMDFKNEIGAILHIGWRGSYLRILEKAIKIFDDFNSNKITVAFGPGICAKCYEVKENLFSYFPRDYFTYKDGKWFLDIFSYNLDILKSYGIKDIILPPACTYESKILYSYRRGESSKIYTILEIKEG